MGLKLRDRWKIKFASYKDRKETVAGNIALRFVHGTQFIHMTENPAIFII